MCKITGGEGSTFLLLLFSFVKIASVEKSMAVKATQNYDVLSAAYGKQDNILIFYLIMECEASHSEAKRAMRSDDEECENNVE